MTPSKTWKKSKLLIPLGAATLLLSACGTLASKPTPSATPIAVVYRIPTSCDSTGMLKAIKSSIANAEVIATQWTPAPGTELADVIDHGGIACSYGVQSAEIGATAMWVENKGQMFEYRIPAWLNAGYKRVDVTGYPKSRAYLLFKPQSPTQEFRVWQLEMLVDGFWIRLSTSSGDTTESNLHFVTAAVKSIQPTT
ncbi:MAG: hypothetical protein WCH42_00295 [Actinomycetes bacterium]